MKHEAKLLHLVDCMYRTTVPACCEADMVVSRVGKERDLFWMCLECGQSRPPVTKLWLK